MEGLVDEAGAGVGGKEHGNAVPELFVVRGGEGAHHDGHGPDHVVADMRAAHALPGSAAEKAGIVLAQDKAAGILPHRVGRHLGNEIGQRQQAGDVGIVLQEGVPKAVRFIGIDGAEDRVIDNGLLLEALPYATLAKGRSSLRIMSLS